MANPVPPLPDADRLTEYNPVTATVGPFDVGFALFFTGSDYDSALQIWNDGELTVPVTDWVLASPSGSDVAVLARPLTDAQITFTSARSGEIIIVGAQRPRRISQAAEGIGIPARDHNRVITELMAIAREHHEKLGRAIAVPVGEGPAEPLPALADRAGHYAMFDDNGDVVAGVAEADLGDLQAAADAAVAANLAADRAEAAAATLTKATRPQAEEGLNDIAYATSLSITQRVRVISGEVNVIDFVALSTDADGGPDTAAGINTALAYALANNLNLVIPGGIWPLDQRINTPNKIIRIRGEQGRGQPTILYKRYVEPDPHKGVIPLGAWGGELLDLQFAAKAGASGGSAISAVLPNNAPNIGMLRLRNLYSSCGDAVNYALLVSGTENTMSGTLGYRSIFAENWEFFGAKIGCVALLCVHHFMGTNILLGAAGGSVESGLILDINGADPVTRINNDIHIHSGLIAGNVYAGYLNNASIMVPVTGTLQYGDHCDKVQWLSVGGGVTGTATNSIILAHNASIAQGGDYLNGWCRYGDGRLEQWGVAATSGSGTATVTFTIPFAASPQHIKVKAREALTPPIPYVPLATVTSNSNTEFAVSTHGLAVPGGSVSALSATVHWRARGV